MSRAVRIVEVGPRDGLQNEAAIVPTDVKVALVDALSHTGVAEVEVTSFVSKEWIPQLADAEEVCRRIRKQPGVTYSALVPNERGLQRALEAKVDKIAVFTAASETFTQRNINTSIDGSFTRFLPVVAGARARGLAVRGYVSTAFWCPYEGKVPVESVAAVIRRLFELGVDEVSIGDTIGKAVPDEVSALLVAVDDLPKERLALHFHDTYGNAARNCVRGYELGVTTFDASVGGLGGCPYAPGAKGNVATDLVTRVLRAAGAEVNVDLDALARARAVLDLPARS